MGSTASSIPVTLLPSAADPAAAALGRVARLVAGAFGVPFVQIVRFDHGGDGMAVAPTSYGALGAVVPDLRAACAALPVSASLIVVEDATRDARVVLPPEARFFAYARMESADGRALGGLCLLDDAPHHLDATRAEHLADFAALSADVVQARRSGGDAEALADAEARFQTLSDTVFDALFILDGGTILDANDQAVALLGVQTPDELIGLSLLDFVPPHLHHDVRARLSEGGRSESVVAHTEGAETPVEVRVAGFAHAGRTLRMAAVRPRRQA